MEYAIGIDLGGTNIKFGLFESQTGAVLLQETQPTRDGDHTDGQPAWAVTIRQWVSETEQSHGPTSYLGIAAPGLATVDHRTIACMPKRLLGLEGLDWSEWMGRPVRVLNDAHAALIGEVWCGAAKGKQNVVLMTLGTGVGGAILVNGKLYTGAHGRAGHVGHLTVNADGPRTGTGMPGGLDWMVGNASLRQRSGGKFTSTHDLVAAVNAGDACAVEFWDRSVYELACGISSIINVLDPEIVVLGGGGAEFGPALFQRLDHHLDSVEWRPNGLRVPMVQAQLHEWAGTYGAAHFAVLGAA